MLCYIDYLEVLDWLSVSSVVVVLLVWLSYLGDFGNFLLLSHQEVMTIAGRNAGAKKRWENASDKNLQVQSFEKNSYLMYNTSLIFKCLLWCELSALKILINTIMHPWEHLVVLIWLCDFLFGSIIWRLKSDILFTETRDSYLFHKIINQSSLLPIKQQG